MICLSFSINKFILLNNQLINKNFDNINDNSLSGLLCLIEKLSTFNKIDKNYSSALLHLLRYVTIGTLCDIADPNKTSTKMKQNKVMMKSDTNI